MTPDSLASAVAKVSVNGNAEIGREDMNGQEQKGARNGTTDNNRVTATKSAIKTDQVHLNGSHGLKHENGVNGNGSVKKERLRAQSQDFAPLKVPAKLPPPFYPQQSTHTSDFSYTSATPYKVVEEDFGISKEGLREPLLQVQTASAIPQAAPIEVFMYGGEVTPAELANSQALAAGAAVYPPFPGYADGKFYIQRLYALLQLTC